MTPPFDAAGVARLKFMRAVAVPEPGPWVSHASFIELTECLSALAAKLKYQYPTIIADIELLRRLVEAAKSVRIHIVVPLMDRGRHPRDLGQFSATFAQHSSVKAVETYFDVIVEYIKSTDLIDPIRRAIISNLGPYLHAWLSLHQHLQLPYPFHGRGFIDILTHVGQYDPIYPLNAEEKIWTIPVDHGAPYFYNPPMIVDEGDDSNIGDFFNPMLAEMQRLVACHTWSSTPETILRLIQARLWVMIGQHNMRRHPGPEMFTLVKASLFYMRMHPEISFDSFCAATRDTWITLFTIISSWPENGGFPYLLDLFRICGRNFFTVSDRVLIVLPVILGTREVHGQPIFVSEHVPRLPIFQLRRGVEFQFSTPGLTHANYLSQFIDAATLVNSTDANSLHILGNFVALTIVEGDSEGVLQSLIERGVTRDFYFNSQSVKRGFCEVLNCLAFDVLFDTTELVEMLQVLRSQAEVAKRHAHQLDQRLAPLEDILALMAEAIGDF